MLLGLLRLSVNPLGPRRSVGVFSRQADDKGAQQNLDVEGEGPVLCVENIVPDTALEFFFRVGAAPVTVDLGEPSDAGLDPVPGKVALGAAGKLLVVVKGVGARANEGHGAVQDIENLRQFIEAPAPEKTSNPGHAQIVGRCLLRFS